MGRIGRVISWLSGAVKNDPGGGAVLTSELFEGSGVDAPPLPGDSVMTVESQGTGFSVAVGIKSGLARVAAPGELRIFARSGVSNVVVSLYLKKDGSAVLTNGSGALTLEPGGSFNINGAIITTSGDVITAAGISLDNHVHPQDSDSDGNSQVNTGAGQ